jgi:hypothetical protein
MGIVMPLVVFIYYTVIVGWLLGFSFFSLSGAFFFPGAEVSGRGRGRTRLPRHLPGHSRRAGRRRRERVHGVGRRRLHLLRDHARA